MKIKRMLISVTDKTGLTEFVQKLKKIIPELEIIASGVTAKELEKENLPYTPLKDFTGFPECFDGRVKTLHPKIAGGLLMRRGKDDKEAKSLNIQPIDMVICNLYDFKKAASDEKKEISELMESMDIGGSTLIRASSKNYNCVCTITDPKDYSLVLDNIAKNNGKVDLEISKQLAVKAINLSADYEATLANVLGKKLGGEETIRPALKNGRELRYGENPDQRAWVYNFEDATGIGTAEVKSGDKLSYNNYLDATESYKAAQGLLDLGAKHGVAIIKHCSLCALATGNRQTETFNLAWEGDPKSSFGSVIALTTPVEFDLIKEIEKKFIEVIIAPDFDPKFVSWVKEKKPRLRLLKVPNRCKSVYFYKNINGGMLCQTEKTIAFNAKNDKYFQPFDPNDEKKIGVVTKRQPKKEQRGLFAFGIICVNFAKSNAIAIVREVSPNCYQLLGLGSGQPNRVDCLERLAIPKAVENIKREKGPDCDCKDEFANCILASDGFFPFDDSIKYAAKWGIKYIIQPGGSIRDGEVKDTANKLDICMIFAGERYFSH